MSMRIGFSTNSLGDIDPLEAVPLIRDLGYRSLAITLDRDVLNPFEPNVTDQASRWRAALAAHGMACVVETGARHLLDPRLKHEPTLVSAEADGRRRRVEFLQRAIDIAVELDAACVSLWSGVVRDAAGEKELWTRLSGSLTPVLEHAGARGIVIGFEPEPGMFVDTLARFGLLLDRFNASEKLRLTVDIGPLVCMGERPLDEALRPWLSRIVNVHVDDMLGCRHDHLPLGAGEVDFAPVLAVLAESGYDGGLHVELPRQSHRWFDTARESARFLQRLLSNRMSP